MGVTTTSDGSIYVADTGHNWIVKYNALGFYVSSFGSEGMGDGQFRQPSYIAADSLDNIYVVDRINNRVQKFDKYGNFITKWGTNGGIPKEDPLENWGEADGDLFLPIGITVDRGNVITQRAGSKTALPSTLMVKSNSPWGYIRENGKSR